MRSTGRGFTLIEVVIGLSLGVIVIGAAVAVLASVMVSNRRQREISEMQRDAQHLTQLLTQELRQAGLGVPTGGHIERTGAGAPSFGSAPPSTGLEFRDRRLLVASAGQVIFVGDLPRQDANYPLFGLLHGRPTGDERIVAFHTENNGSCVPTNCVAGAASVFFPGAGNCTGTERECPWQLRRVVAGDRVQIVDGQARWSHNGVADLTANVGPTGVIGMDLTKDMDASASTQWGNTNPGDGPGGLVGQGWITSLDRVQYLFNAGPRTVTRRQCYGDPDTGSANWATANPVAGGVCTPSEVIARNVVAFDFHYFDQNQNETNPASATDRNLVRRVSWEVRFEVTAAVLGPSPVAYVGTGSAELKNIQPGEP